jgi:hypothetical protein
VTDCARILGFLLLYLVRKREKHIRNTWLIKQAQVGKLIFVEQFAKPVTIVSPMKSFFCVSQYLGMKPNRTRESCFAKLDSNALLKVELWFALYIGADQEELPAETNT